MAEDEISVTLSSDTEVTIERFNASGKYLIVWLAPEYGWKTTHRTLATSLVQQDLEVWMSNISESLFLPQGSQSIKKLDGRYVADIIEQAHLSTGKKVIVMGDSYAAISALRGAHQWQQRQHKNNYLIGAILVTPYTYAYIPPLGLAPEYVPVVSATNIPIMIFQAAKSASINQFGRLTEQLQQHNNPLYYKLMPEIMGLFYEDPPTNKILDNLKTLPIYLKKMIRVLENHKLPNQVIALKTNSHNKRIMDINLKEFKGNKTPIKIELEDVNGNLVSRTDFKGQLTMINFWATWCPPCVEEIPSLNRLKDKMAGLPFELISINYTEERQDIIDFMKKVNVEFPILLDKDGRLAKEYNVITYPSTFIIDKQGKIKYGVNAAIEWDDPELIKQLKSSL